MGNVILLSFWSRWYHFSYLSLFICFFLLQPSWSFEVYWSRKKCNRIYFKKQDLSFPRFYVTRDIVIPSPWVSCSVYNGVHLAYNTKNSRAKTWPVSIYTTRPKCRYLRPYSFSISYVFRKNKTSAATYLGLSHLAVFVHSAGFGHSSSFNRWCTSINGATLVHWKVYSIR